MGWNVLNKHFGHCKSLVVGENWGKRFPEAIFSRRGKTLARERFY